MKRLKASLFILLCLTLTVPATADIKAVIVDLEGEVQVSRRGSFLDESEVDYGTELFTHDILQTGPDGYAELSVETPVSPELTIKVMEGTTLFIEHSLTRQSQKTSLNLHRGAVQTRAAALVRNSEFNIKTDSSVMGIRGTTFTVNTSPDTALMVSCREGKVVCTTDGEDAFIQPGKIYETSPAGQYAIKALAAEDIDDYTRSWNEERMEALMINGAMSLEHYANLYLQTAPGFLESFTELDAKQDIFKKWEGIIEEGQTMSMGDATRDKIALSNGIIRLRSRLPIMEHVFYTLYDLTDIMDQYPDQKSRLSEAAGRTLKIYNRRQEEFIEKLTLARYYFKIFIEIDKQSSGHSMMPSDDLMEGFLLDDSFFVAPPAPGGGF
jgi:hypothetical protein